MKRTVVAVGVVAVALAVVTAVTGFGTGGAGGLTGVVQTLALLGGAAAIVAGGWLLARQQPERQGPIPAVERAAASDPPGARLDEALGSLVGRGRVELTPRGIRDALRHAATGVIAAREGIATADARATVDDGSWTDDDVAARFLAASWSLPTESLANGVRRALGRGPERPLRRAARHAADAVAARAGITGPGDAPAATWFPPTASEGATARTVSAPEFADDDGADRSERTVRRSRARTRRFRGVAAFALLALGVGTVLGAPAAAFAAVPAVAMLAWARTREIPDVSLAVEREVEDEHPDRGDRVRVRTTVRNSGDRTLPDVRLVDGVPAALAVVEGSPRRQCRLRPGETVTIAYAVRARRGVHSFEAALAIVRDSAGTVEERHVVAATDAIRCVPALDRTGPTVPLRQQAGPYAGNVDVDDGGPGLEFYQTREYRHGDPLSRVDWHRLARTGDLATTEFRQERAATVVLVVDARAAGYVAPSPVGPHALDRGVDAAGTLAVALLADGNRVGLGAVSTADCWVPPGAGDGHREHLRRVLGSNPALSPVPAARNLRVKQSVDRLRQRIPNGAQVYFLTPLCDDRAARIARRFEAGGRAVTVVSPDPTLADTPSLRLARVGRRLRVTGLRQRGVRVVDWGSDEPLAVALGRARARGDVRGAVRGAVGGEAP